VVLGAFQQRRGERAVHENSSIAAAEDAETAWQEQPAQDGADDEDALAALETASSEETEEATSVADFWSESETEEETAAVSEQNDDYSATVRALEALDQHVDDANVDAEDDDPIRRLLAERSGTRYESDSDSDDDSWESRFSSDDDEESADDDATLLAMFSQDRGAAKTAVDWEETETDAEVETGEQTAKSDSTNWECPLCGQQSHRVEPS
jgi:hypothetical protein